MKQFILKEKLKDIIAGRAVLAALFHTFNFDPRFFENYVMPLFVPGKDFRDEIIYNKIIWRNCIKEGIIPPVTVYCDYFVKDNVQAPSLGYDIFCIKTPAAKGSICNFHPKHIFLLLEGGSLLVVTGSGNLTSSGWCDNFECFSMQEIRGNRDYPTKTTTNILQQIITDTRKLAGLTNYTETESLIDEHLRYVDFKRSYFNSLNQSFRAFLEKNVFEIDNISEMEIVSPYFSNDTKLIDYLKNEKSLKKIKCLIPTLKDNEVLLSKEVFLRFRESGLQWCFWEKYSQDGKVQNRNNEVRNQHAKIYRFYGENKTFTVIGSVNFTNPAWAEYTYRNNKANIESAWLYVENDNSIKILKTAGDLDPDNLRFNEQDTLENGKSAAFVSREVPDIDFIIDWKTRKILVKAKNNPLACSFKNIFMGTPIVQGNRELNLFGDDLKNLVANTLVEVAQKKNDETIIHTYYPRQLNTENKPLDFKLNATTILQYWDFLDDEYRKDSMTRSLAEKSTDDSGFIDDGKVEQKLLLNEMAAHFSGLVRLEKFVFPVYIQNKGDRREQFRQIRYYLLSENIDTLPYYIEDLKIQYEQGKIQKSFFWMILQVLLINFYKKAARWVYRHDIPVQDWKDFKNDNASKIHYLIGLGSEAARSIDCIEAKLTWVQEQLAINYE